MDQDQQSKPQNTGSEPTKKIEGEWVYVPSGVPSPQEQLGHLPPGGYLEVNLPKD